MSDLYKQESWSVYQSNLQTYRSNFISSQSLLLTAGAIVYDKNNCVFITIATVALFQMWYIWFRVIIARLYLLDFHVYNLHEHFDLKGNRIKPDISDNERLNEDTYVSNRTIRLKVNKAIPDLKKLKNHQHNYKNEFKNIRLTRFKVDVLIPISLTIIWGVFIVTLFVG